MSTEERDPEAVLEEFGDLFGDILGDFFGGTATKGPDLRMELELDREDLVRGKRTVTIERFIACAGCHGSGREPAAGSPCPTCVGKGKQHTRRGAFQLSTHCPDCAGSGSSEQCRRCEGACGETRTETLHVTIPPQIQDGQMLRLRGKGGDRSDGKGAGDLYLVIRMPWAVPAHIPVRETGGVSSAPWIALGVAVLAIVVAALLLR